MSSAPNAGQPSKTLARTRTPIIGSPHSLTVPAVRETVGTGTPGSLLPHVWLLVVLLMSHKPHASLLPQFHLALTLARPITYNRFTDTALSGVRVQCFGAKSTRASP